MLKKIKWLVLIAVVSAVVIMIRTSNHVPFERVSTEKYQQIFNEITSFGLSIGLLAPDNSGSTLAYVCDTDVRRSLVLLNLKTLERNLVELSNEVTQVNGWSADDQQLAFVQTVPLGKESKNDFKLRDSWLTFIDLKKNPPHRLTADTNVVEQFFFWLPSERYVYSQRSMAKANAEIMLGTIGSNELVKVSNYMPELVLMSDRLMGYAYKGNLFELELKALKHSEELGWDDSTRTVKQLSDFPTNQFTEIKWLRYSRESSNFLFCARPADSNWRYLFQFNPAKQQLIQLSREATYNGQWLQQGTGFAYVINTNGGFYLAVRPKDSSAHTNLFVDGGVVNYTVAPNGNVIYMTAAQETEPYGIWEYNITNQSLRCLYGVTGQSLAASKRIKPKEFKVKADDGVEIPCFLLEPPMLEEEKVDQPKKYPAVIYLPPPSSQFQKAFEERSQLIANLGFYYQVVNYRGCDGYGEEFSRLANTSKAALDVLKARDELLKDNRVDSKNIFLCAASGGAAVVMELVATSPKLWRGVVLDKPGPFSIGDERYNTKKFPPFLLILGDLDDRFAKLKKFESLVREQGVEVQSLVHTNSGHWTFKLSERRSALDYSARFFLDHVK